MTLPPTPVFAPSSLVGAMIGGVGVGSCAVGTLVDAGVSAYPEGMARSYLPEQLTRADVDDLPGLTVMQFGTDWCGYCQAAEPAITEVLSGLDVDRHVLIEDGKGRPLGRSFRVKLWPTLIFLRDGVELARVVRPWRSDDFADALVLVRSALGPRGSNNG